MLPNLLMYYSKFILKVQSGCKDTIALVAATCQGWTGMGQGLDLSKFLFHAQFDRLHWLGVPKDKGKAPILLSTANKIIPVIVLNALYLVRRKAHDPVWDDGESRDLVNQNVLGFWISTPFPA